MPDTSIMLFNAKYGIVLYGVKHPEMQHQVTMSVASNGIPKTSLNKSMPNHAAFSIDCHSMFRALHFISWHKNGSNSCSDNFYNFTIPCNFPASIGVVVRAFKIPCQSMLQMVWCDIDFWGLFCNMASCLKQCQLVLWFRLCHSLPLNAIQDHAVPLMYATLIQMRVLFIHCLCWTK